jgi:hypothetical protein
MAKFTRSTMFDHVLRSCFMAMSPRFVAQATSPLIWRIEDPLLRPRPRGGAGRYLNIASQGCSYDDPQKEHNTVLLPLYPLARRVCHKATGLSVPLCGTLLSNLAFLASLPGLYSLAARELRPEVARPAILLLAFSPGSWFFSGMPVGRP